MNVSFAKAQDYLERDLDRNLVLLGALHYEPVEALYGVTRGSQLAALAVVLEPSWAPQDQYPTILLAAEDGAALAELLPQNDWPAPAVWTICLAELLPLLEEMLGRAHTPARGQFYYVTATAPQRHSPLVRRLTLDDAATLDLSPCSLSPSALRNWLRRGWRVFGAVQSGVLLSHAMVAYPIGDTEEIAAVFTAPWARGRGLASAVVAAAIADIVGRGLRAIYATKKVNLASQRVAAGLGLQPLLETWEIVTGAA